MVVKRRFSWAAVVALAGIHLLSGCDSEKTPGLEAPDGEWVRYGFQDEVASGRASVEVDEPFRFRWDAGDRVTMWIGADEADASPYVFQTERGGVGGASFEGLLPKEKESRYYFGFYPASDGGEEAGERSVIVPVDGTIRQEKANSSAHLAPYRAMFARPVSRTESHTTLEGVNFKHLTSLLVFELTNSRNAPTRVSGVTLRASRPVFFGQASFLPGSGQEELTPISDAVDEVTLTLGDDSSGMLLEASGGMARAFLPLIPSASLEDVSLSVVVCADGERQESLSLSPAELQEAGVDRLLPGHYYHFYLDMDGFGVTWDMEKSVEAWEQGGIIDIPVK